MKYLCLAYEAQATFDTMPRREWETVREETLAYVDALKHSGHLIDARPLQSATTAATLKVRNGQLSMTDGPFAETKEQLGGYFLIEAAISTKRSRLPRNGQARATARSKCVPTRAGAAPGRWAQPVACSI